MSDACPVCNGQPIAQVKYVSMCDAHKAEQLDLDRRTAGIPDLTYLVTDPDTDLSPMIEDIKFKLRQQPTRSIIIIKLTRPA